jgi:hypothetical protein
MQRLPAGSIGGGGLALTVVLSHFPELELLGSGLNMDLTEGQLEAFWTRMH